MSREDRERVGLKPNEEYGGKGIVLGWESTDAEWEAGLAAANEEPYIVQDRITLPTEAYPSVVNGELKIFDRVTAGGGSNVPTYVIEPR